MANNETLIPTYVESDYNTMLVKFKDLLSQSDTFKDYNYEGSNIAMIMELLTYMGDFTNFYTNMVAKNVYLDTANIYETVHRLVTQKGYIPLGWLSSEATVNITIEDITLEIGDEVVIPSWQTIDTGLTTDDGDQIYYTLTYQHTETVETDGSVDISLQLRQGSIHSIDYYSTDIIDNQIVLPFRQYDTGMYPFDVASIQVMVEDQEWIRVHDFYDNISGLTPDERDIYSFLYDKYKRYAVSFASAFEIPSRGDTISIKMLKSLGTEGIISSSTFNTSSTGVSDLVIYNANKNQPIPNQDQLVQYTTEHMTLFENPDASVGGSDPETITELKNNADANMHTQFRNVTSKDYKFHLEMRSDVIKGTAWGEQEVDPGNTIEYNKVYVSCIPREGNVTMFMDGTLNTEDLPWQDYYVPALSATIENPTTYTTAFHNDLLRYLEPRKMISVYEVPTVPSTVYFRFDIGVRNNRAYQFMDVVNDVRAKLQYFFDPINREFKEEINFMDIHNFIYDLSIAEDDNAFLNIKGLDNLVIREIATYTHALSGESLSGALSGETETPSGAYHIYEPNIVNRYPQYTQEVKDGYYDNKLRPIQLGYDQFPLLSIDMCRFTNEG